MKIVEVEFEGFKTDVELKPCGRCKKLPTAEDALRALKHSVSTMKKCAVCGLHGPIAGRHGLYHSFDISCNGEKSDGFILCGAEGFNGAEWHPDWHSIYSCGPGGVLDGSFHTACLKKVAPGIVIHPR